MDKIKAKEHLTNLSKEQTSWEWLLALSSQFSAFFSGGKKNKNNARSLLIIKPCNRAVILNQGSGAPWGTTQSFERCCEEVSEMVGDRKIS